MEDLKLIGNLKKELPTKKIIEKKTSDALFDMSKPVSKEVIFWTFSTVFVLTVLIAGVLKIYSKKLKEEGYL